MASLRLGFAVLGALAAGLGTAPPAAAQNVCVTVTVTVVVVGSEAVPQTCATTPLPTRPLHQEAGYPQYVWLEVSVTYP